MGDLRIAGGTALEVTGHGEKISSTLRELADRVDSGEIEATSLVAVLDTEDDIFVRRYSAFHTALGMLEHAKYSLIASGDDA